MRAATSEYVSGLRQSYRSKDFETRLDPENAAEAKEVKLACLSLTDPASRGGESPPHFELGGNEGFPAV